MLTVAVGWELYERTGSALALGGVGLAQVFPVFLLTLPAGHASDRFDRKLVLVLAQLLLAVSAFGLAIVSAVGGAVSIVYLLLFAAGTGRAFAGPAKESLSPQLVPPALFGNAATWRSSAWQLAAVLGPAAGGAVIGFRHSATPAFVIARLAGLVFADTGGAGAAATRSSEARTAAPVSACVAGIRFVWRSR